MENITAQFTFVYEYSAFKLHIKNNNNTKYIQTA